MIGASILAWRIFPLLISMASFHPALQSESALPAFGRNTVLVYKNSLESNSTVVVRIAQFAPDRYVEWEDAITQGTILMAAKAVTDAREFTTWKLFQAGSDTKGKDATTIWLSRRIFRELKERQKAKFSIDGIDTNVTLLGGDQMSIEVNRSNRSVAVIKTKDERGAERWFLDSEDNPLIVNFLVRSYQEKLTSITTDRPNTLRWIKK
jgi:hypothetical protein